MSLPATLRPRLSLADALRNSLAPGTLPAGELRIQCRLCPNVIAEHESFTAQCTARARMYCLSLFDDPGGDDCVDVCGTCLAEVVLWCLDNRPDLLRAS